MTQICDNKGIESPENLERLGISPDNDSFRNMDGALYSNDGRTLLRIPTDYKTECFAVPDHVREIGDFAFESCHTLTGVVIPDSVTRIGYGAFWDCSRLQSIRIPKSVTYIGRHPSCDGIKADDKYMSDEVSVFTECHALTRIDIDEDNPVFCSKEGVLFTKDMSKLIIFPEGHGKEYTIPEGVKCIGNSAFYGYEQLERIEIPSSVISIENWAFSFCTGLRKVMIPSSVKWIAENAFSKSGAFM